MTDSDLTDPSPGGDGTEPNSDPTVVGIGTSAGGLAALKTFFSYVPADTKLAYVIVVHLSPEHESHLAELLQPGLPIPVEQVTATVRLEPRHVYVIPPNANLEAVDTHLRLSALEEMRQERAPVDHFFRTLARTHTGHAIGVILTGTGSDGALGMRAIKEKGGLTVVQDPVEAEHPGMPESALATDAVDLVLPLAKIPEAVHGYAGTTPRLPDSVADEDGEWDRSPLLRNVFAKLRVRTGRDFSRYKRSTIMRRIRHRMQFHHLEELGEYLDLLEEEPEETRALADELLVTVTSFFRDPEVFQALKEEVLPNLFDRKRPNDQLRAWSVGCATGEEPYSLAMLFLEEAAVREETPELQIFATDLHERSLERARAGLYAGDIEGDVGAERVQRFFREEEGGYRIRRGVREVGVFSSHDLLGDPPFSHLDLILCRNVLIYLQRDVQKDVFRVFHYALERESFLVLGNAETVAGKLFRVEDREHHIYRRKDVAVSEPRLPVFSLQRTHDAE